jgi:hypothetical protein
MRVVLKFHFVVGLVPVPQSRQNLDGVFHRRRIHDNGLEPAFQGGIMLDVLSVFVHGGRPNALEFASGQRRFQHVGSVDGALGRAGPDHGVKLVDKEDDLIFRSANFVHNILEALFKFAAVFGAGHDSRQVQGHHAFAREEVRGFVGREALRQPFDNRGFPHPGIAD